MAVKCSRKIVPKSYFCSPYIERKRSYTLRSSGSGLNLSKGSPDGNVKYLKFTPKVNLECSVILSPLTIPDMKKGCLVRKTFTKEKKSASLSKSLKTKGESPLNRNAKRQKSTPDSENDHPMRKKLRELASTAEPKSTSCVQNISLNQDLNNSVLTRNQRKSLNLVSSDSLVPECILHGPRRVIRSKKSSVKITSLTIKKEKKVLKKDRDPLVSDSSSQLPLKDLPVTDVLVCSPQTPKDQNFQKVKGRKIKSAPKYLQETPVIQNSLRSLRSKSNCRILDEENSKNISSKTIQKSNMPNTSSKQNCLNPQLNGVPTDDILCSLREGRQCNVEKTEVKSSTKIPVITQNYSRSLNSKSCPLSRDELTCTPDRLSKASSYSKGASKTKSKDSTNATSFSDLETPVTTRFKKSNQSEFRSGRANTLLKRSQQEKTSLPIDVICRDSEVNTKQFSDVDEVKSFNSVKKKGISIPKDILTTANTISSQPKRKSNKKEVNSEKAAPPLKRSLRKKTSLPIDLICQNPDVNTKFSCNDVEEKKRDSAKKESISISKEIITAVDTISTRSKRKSKENVLKPGRAEAPPKRSLRKKTIPIDSICGDSELNTKQLSYDDFEDKKRASAKGKNISVPKENVTVTDEEKTSDKGHKINSKATVTRRSTRSSISLRDVLLDSLVLTKKPNQKSLPNSNEINLRSLVKTHNEDKCNNVPIDILTTTSLDSLHKSQDSSSKIELGNRKVFSKEAFPAKDLDPAKPIISDASLKGKKTLPEEIMGSKKDIPRKGTMKRKRWIMKTLKETSEGYEDDIFENHEIEASTPLVPPMIFDDGDESDATDFSIATPVCGFLLTPNIPKKSPQYKPCISTNELLAARKVAEEYLYRRNKKWKNSGFNNLQSKTETPKNSRTLEEKVEVSEALANVLKAGEEIEKLTKEQSDEEDDYFSDGS